ncbi:MAG TPA: N-succinylarginine dihydrolase [Polyangiaceae bacterium]|jgi:succinylarginine dihydrolase|nr:N-succinylarginine dihydrolase [Polyangiaceae bacterium]
MAHSPELQFDGLVGPTHNYAGLSPGNVASAAHAGEASNPRAAAHQGLAKMRFVRDLGVTQAVLPPHDRPSLAALRRLGFRGRDEEVLAAAAAGDGLALRLCSSASAMWTANAATVAPSSDTADGRVHLVPANLQQMFHRAIEAATTTRVLRAIFGDPARFVVHDPLPGGGQLADEGAANHLRLETSAGAAHVFAWGRRAWGPFSGPSAHPARQTHEASAALARLHQLDAARCFFPQQHPDGIDGGAFHTDVLAVGNARFLMLHELAFAGGTDVVDALRRALGEELFVVQASRDELPIERAVAAYPFNSQVLTLPDGSMAIVAPADAREDERSRALLERCADGASPVRAVHYLDVRQSMHNGGGPACLRLRVPLTHEEAGALGGNVVLGDALLGALGAWVDRHYRDRLVAADLADPELARESMRALDELTQLLGLGSVYDYQRTPDLDRSGEPP